MNNTMVHHLNPVSNEQRAAAEALNHLANWDDRMGLSPFAIIDCFEGGAVFREEAQAIVLVLSRFYHGADADCFNDKIVARALEGIGSLLALAEWADFADEAKRVVKRAENSQS